MTQSIRWMPENTIWDMKHIINMIDMMTPCIDGYLYIYDTKNDSYYISANALDRFPISPEQLQGVKETLRDVVYPADFEQLQEEIQKMIRQEMEFHDLKYRWIDHDGQVVWVNGRGRVAYDAEGHANFIVGCINEIGTQPKADNASGLLGEFSLRQEFQDQTMPSKGFMLRLGIDYFKEISENKGMNYGDMVLRKTAECIRSVILPGQELYRIAADEVVVVDFSQRGLEEAKNLYSRIRHQINLFIEENCYDVFYTISAGIVDFSTVQADTYFDLMKWAEFSLNEARSSGKNNYYIYNTDEYQTFSHQRRLIRMMRRSVSRNFDGFELHCQPIVDIKENVLFGMEVLLRFHTEESGVVSPAEFIPLLEESGLIIPVGRWVLHQAMRRCSKMQEKIPDFRVHVNISYIQVLKSDVLQEIITGMKEYNLKRGSIVAELTESGFLEENQNFIDFCKGLIENHVPLALDDFGTGYSNFHYLYDLKPVTIKIDRSFTQKALGNSYENTLLRYIVRMAHSLGLNICIEGIETEQELDKIYEIEPDYIQGYYFGKPCPFEQFLKEHVHE